MGCFGIRGPFLFVSLPPAKTDRGQRRCALSTRGGHAQWNSIDWCLAAGSIDLLTSQLGVASNFAGFACLGAPYWQELWELLGCQLQFCADLSCYTCGLALSGALSALLHIACELPVHGADVHRNLRPLTNRRARSGLSSWTSRHDGAILGQVVRTATLFMIIVLFRQFSAIWLRVLLGLSGGRHGAMPFCMSLSRYPMAV